MSSIRYSKIDKSNLKSISLSIGIYIKIDMAMKKVMVALPGEMVNLLEKERKDRYLETIPETIRVILSDYLRMKSKSK
jgi:hypothetical protein